MPKGTGYDIICPGCAESYHETTESYDSDIDANAGMLKLKDKYKSYGWNEPPPDPTCGYGVLECPECEAPLAPSGRFKVRLKEATMAEGAVISIGTGDEQEFKPDMVLSENIVLGRTPDEESDFDVPRETSVESATQEEPIVIESDEKLPPLIVDGKGTIKAFICPHPNCQREFKKKANLGAHMRVHKK